MPPPDNSSLLVELLYKRETRLDEGRLVAEVNKILPHTVLTGDDRQPTLLVHEGYGDVYPSRAGVPVMSVLMTVDHDDQLKTRPGSTSARRGGSRRHRRCWTGAGRP